MRDEQLGKRQAVQSLRLVHLDARVLDPERLLHRRNLVIRTDQSTDQARRRACRCTPQRVQMIRRLEDEHPAPVVRHNPGNPTVLERGGVGSLVILFSVNQSRCTHVAEKEHRRLDTWEEECLQCGLVARFQDPDHASRHVSSSTICRSAPGAWSLLPRRA